MENLNLIRKVAHKFARKTNINYQELFSEACLWYCEALEKYDPSKEVKKTTYAYQVMHNQVLNYCKKERRHKDFIRNFDDPYARIKLREKFDWSWEWIMYSFEEYIEDWPEDCQIIVQMVKTNPEAFLTDQFIHSTNGLTPLKRMKIKLRKRGWTYKRIGIAIRRIKKLILELPLKLKSKNLNI